MTNTSETIAGDEPTPLSEDEGSSVEAPQEAIDDATESEQPDEPNVDLTEDEMSEVFPEVKTDPEEGRRLAYEGLLRRNVERIAKVDDPEEREELLSKYPEMRKEVEARLMEKEFEVEIPQSQNLEIRERERKLQMREFRVELSALPEDLGMSKAEFATHKTELIKKVSELRSTEYGKLMPVGELLQSAAAKLGLYGKAKQDQQKKAEKEQLRSDMELPSTSGARLPSFQLKTVEQVDALSPEARTAYYDECEERFGESRFK